MKKDKKQKTLQRIMEYMKPYRFLIFASLILAGADTLCSNFDRTRCGLPYSKRKC